MDDLRIGVIGCGAVAAKYHLPALQQAAGGRVTALVDTCLERAGELAADYGVEHVATDYRVVLDHVDALVLALPHHLHVIIGVDVLKAGKHVLMEKPLANTVEECDELIAIFVASIGTARRNDRERGQEGGDALAE